MLVSIPNDPSLATNAQVSANDILFTSSDGTTKLFHEIESYTYPQRPVYRGRPGPQEPVANGSG